MEVEAYSYQDIRRELKRRGLKANGKLPELRKRLSADIKTIESPVVVQKKRPCLEPTTRTKLRAQVTALTNALVATTDTSLDAKFQELREKSDRANANYAHLLELRAEMDFERSHLDTVLDENLDLTKLMAQTYTTTVAALSSTSAADQILAQKIQQKAQTSETAADVFKSMVSGFAARFNA